MENLQLTINRLRPELRDAAKDVDELTLLQQWQGDYKKELDHEKARSVQFEKEKDTLKSLEVTVTAATVALQILNNTWIAQGKKLPKPKALLDAEKNLSSAERNRNVQKVKVGNFEADLKTIQNNKKDIDSKIKSLLKSRQGKESDLNKAKAKLSTLETQYQQLNSQQNQQLAAAVGPMPDAGLPVAFLPVHLQTRFHRTGDQSELLIRIVPDALHVDTHESELTETENTYGKYYWERIWHIGLGQDENSETQRQSTWAQLCQRFTPQRSAWIIKAMKPLNPDDQPRDPINEDRPLPKQIRFPEPERRSSTWTRAPLASGLPDRWVAYGYNDAGERVLLAWGNPLATSLHIGPDPQALPPETLSEEQLAVDKGIRWLFDFQEAENKGMAIRAPLSPQEANNGIATLVVMGLKTSLNGTATSAELEKLLQGHHYTDGLSFMPQGTPTNNIEELPSGYSSIDPGFAASYTIECKDPNTTVGANALNLAQALGIDTQTFDHIQHAEGKEQLEGRWMRAALWPVTWGYFMEQMMGKDQITPEMVRQVRRHFIDHTAGSGPLPAIRAGKQPFGILPATALNHWKPEVVEDLPPRLVSLLQQSSGASGLRNIWKKAVSFVPNISNSQSGGQPLLDILSMNALSGQFEAKYMLDDVLLGNAGVSQIPVLQKPELDQRQRTAAETLEKLGIPGAHRLLDAVFSLATLTLKTPIVAESDGQSGYIRRLYSSDVRSLMSEQGVPGDVNLLCLLLRHALLVAYSNAAFRILLQDGKVKWENRLEPVLVDIQVASDAEKTPTLGRYLEVKVPKLDKTNQNRPLAEYIHTLTQSDHPALAEVDELRESLRALEKLPVGRLSDLFRETIDLCSHRLDAWITSLAAKRLSEMRKKQPTGLQLGGFGWVENLKPANPLTPVNGVIPGEEGSTIYRSSQKGGYIHAPSIDQAATAAILRSGYLAQGGNPDSNRFAIDLSSERARLAQNLLQGVREGQSLAALLGYRFERGLHERGLDQYIESFRLLAPLGELYKAESEKLIAGQELSKLEAWDSPELKILKNGKEQFEKKIKEFEVRRKKLYPLEKVDKDLGDIFNLIRYHTGHIRSNTLKIEDVSLEEEKKKLKQEITSSRSALYNLVDKLSIEIKNINNKSAEIRELIREISRYSLKISNSTVNIEIKFQNIYKTYSNEDEPWPNPLIESINKTFWLQATLEPTKEYIAFLSESKNKLFKNAALTKLKGYKDEGFSNAMKDILKLFDQYMVDVSKPHPQISTAIENLRKSTEVYENLKRAYRAQYLLPADAEIESLESVPAQQVVDGLALLRKWRDQEKEQYIPFGSAVGTKNIKLPASGPEYKGLVAELDALADAVDAVGDAVTAESLYQMVKGNPDRAAASLDAIARGESPPAELEFLKTPRGGASLTHRFFLLLNEKQPASNWPVTAKQVRAIAEPALNLWVAQLLGNPDKILIQADYLHPETKAVLATREFQLSELKISALDFLYMANRDAVPLQSELEQRIEYHLLGTRPAGIPEDAGVQLSFERGANWRPDQFSLGEMLETGRTVREMVAQARPLQPHHLQMAGKTIPSTLDETELQQRTKAIYSAFDAARKKLAQLLEGPQQLILSELRDALIAFADFGLPGSIPVSAVGESTADKQRLTDQGTGVLREVDRRWQEAQKILTDAGTDKKIEALTTGLQTLLHPDFQVLPLFRLAESDLAVQSLKQSDSLQGNDPFAVCAWIERVARVRDALGLWNDSLLYVQALQQNYYNHYRVGQLPFQAGDRWMGLPLQAGTEAPSGYVSLVGYMPYGMECTVRQAGLMIDDWTEIIPKTKQVTGVAFQYDKPCARAPQSVLLAVPPAGMEKWSMEILEDIILETNEMSKLRTVDPEALSRVETPVSQFLPAVYLSFNMNGDTVSTDPQKAFVLPEIK